MKKRILTGILCLTAAAFLVVGCQSDSSGDSAKDTSQESESILGQVTAIEDGTITLALGERSENEKMQPPANKEDDGGTWELLRMVKTAALPRIQRMAVPLRAVKTATLPRMRRMAVPLRAVRTAALPRTAGTVCRAGWNLRVRKPPLLQMIPCLLFWTPEEKPLRVPWMTSL